MKKITLLFAVAFLFNYESYSQVTTEISGSIFDIAIDSNNLYFSAISTSPSPSGSLIRKLNIGPGFPTISTMLFIEAVDDRYATSLALNGTDLYYFSILNYFFSDPSLIMKTNTINFSTPTLFANFTCSNAGGYLWTPLVFKSNLLYASASCTPGSIITYNSLSTAPVSPTTFYSEPGALFIDGDIMYRGDSSGNIYSKNLLTGFPFSLIFTNPTGNPITSLAKFEGYMYFANYLDGIQRFNTSAVIPVVETIASSSYFVNEIVRLTPKILYTGNRVLYAVDFGQKLIKINLDDPSLVINQNTISKSNVYPNPTKDLIHIQSNAQINAIELYDLIGKKVLEEKPIENLTEKSLDISKLEPNIYLLKIKTADGDESKKIIKQ